MKKLILVLNILFLAAALPPIISPTATAATAEGHVIAIIGGFGSCSFIGNPDDMNMSAKFSELVGHYEQALQTRALVFKACYALSSDVLFYTGPTGETTGGTLESFIEELEAYAGASNITLIGQSHGGWTAMYAALSLPAGSVAHLITIDPISMVDCSSVSFIASSSSSLFFGSNPQVGCTSAPKDFTTADYTYLHNTVGYWLNAWQDQFSFLHSGPIEAASENMDIVFQEPTWSLMGAHYQMETSPVVWRRVTEILSH